MGIDSDELLRPLVAFDDIEGAAEQLHRLAVANRDLLRRRGLDEELSNFAISQNIAQATLNRARLRKDRLGQYAIIGTTGRVLGAAAITPGVVPSKMRIAVSPAYSPSFLRQDFRFANPMIKAWTDEDHYDYLYLAYRQLSLMAFRPYVVGDTHESPWTYEPVRSPGWVHEAITANHGLSKVVQGRITSDTSSRALPPKSIIYAKLSGRWFSGSGRRQELAEGNTTRRIRPANDPGPDA